MTSADHVIVCHAMCDEIGKTFERDQSHTYIHADNFTAGTWRQAELRLNLPSRLFAAMRDKNANAQNTGASNIQSRHSEENLSSKDATKLKAHTFRSHDRVMANTKTKSRRDADDFDGDDLQLDDFLIANERRDKPKEPTKPQPPQFEDIGWFSIDATPPTPAKRAPPKVSNLQEDDWAVDIDEAEEEYEPVRLANGKWACNHKCKDKSRFENPLLSLLLI